MGGHDYHVSPARKSNTSPKGIRGFSFVEALMGKKERVLEVEEVGSEVEEVCCW